MATVEHLYERPERFVAGTVGEPGARTFFLQAKQGNKLTSVACEKQQVAVLAEHLERVLDEVIRRSSESLDVPPAQANARDTQPLDVPITEEFRVGTMTIAWDPADGRIVIEMFSTTDQEVDEDALPQGDEAAEEVAQAEALAAEEVFIVKITMVEARDFIARAQAVVAAGRPVCPFCLQPMDPQGHICPRANGYRRPLF